MACPIIVRHLNPVGAPLHGLLDSVANMFPLVIQETETFNVWTFKGKLMNNRKRGVLIHMAGYLGIIVPGFTNIFGVYLMWKLMDDETDFIDRTGQSAVNFQITWSLILGASTAFFLIGAAFAIVLVAIPWLGLVTYGTYQAYHGEVYEYPLTLDLV